MERFRIHALAFLIMRPMAMPPPAAQYVHEPIPRTSFASSSPLLLPGGES